MTFHLKAEHSNSLKLSNKIGLVVQAVIPGAQGAKANRFQVQGVLELQSTGPAWEFSETLSQNENGKMELCIVQW